MDYFFISGTWDTGKNALIHEITWTLINNGYADITAGFPIPRVATSTEFACILEGLNNQGVRVRILINTATDDMECINGLMEFLGKHAPVDILITSIRDGLDRMRTELLSRLPFNNESDSIIELPLARIVGQRGDFGFALTQYQTTLQNLAMHVLGLPPFNL